MTSLLRNKNSIFRRRVQRACQNLRMNNGDIEKQPFFNATHVVTPKDGDSGDESTYAPSTRMFRVRRKRYLDIIDKVMSK